MKKMDGLAERFRRVRDEIKVTQNEMAAILGLSEKAIQSYEQGWRHPPDSVQRLLNVVYITHRIGKRGETVTCWAEKHCLPSVRKRCAAYQTRQGHLCWLLTGTHCGGQEMANYEEKGEACHRCKVYRHLGMVDGH